MKFRLQQWPSQDSYSVVAMRGQRTVAKTNSVNVPPEHVNYATHDAYPARHPDTWHEPTGQMLWSGEYTQHIPVVLWAVCSGLFSCLVCLY